jgi:hypothetical protein
MCVGMSSPHIQKAYLNHGTSYFPVWVGVHRGHLPQRARRWFREGQASGGIGKVKDVVSALAGIGELKTAAVENIGIQNLYTAVADNWRKRVAVVDIGFGWKDVAAVDNGCQWEELAAAGIEKKVVDFVKRDLVHRIGTGLAGHD